MQLAMVPTYAIVPPCVSEGEPRYRMWNNASKHRPVDRNGKASFMDASSRPVCPFTCTSWRSMLLSAGDALWPKLYVCACIYIYIDRERERLWLYKLYMFFSGGVTPWTHEFSVPVNRKGTVSSRRSPGVLSAGNAKQQRQPTLETANMSRQNRREFLQG